MIGALICFLAALVNIPFMLHGSVINYIAFAICLTCGCSILWGELK